MDNIAIQTSQNIAIEQTVASVGERIVAAIIDYSFVIVYTLTISITGLAESSPLVFSLMVFPIFIFYHLVSELAMNGQTWGKKIMKIKVVKMDGTEGDFVSYLIRWVFRIIDIWFLFGAVSTIVIIMNGKGQRIGDIAAHTTVIRLKERKLNDTLYTKIPDNHNLTFSQVSMLAASDIYTAREVLDYIDETYCSEESMQMAYKAKSAIETKLGVRSELKPEAFLKTIVLDYNYVNSR